MHAKYLVECLAVSHLLLWNDPQNLTLKSPKFGLLPKAVL